jgi:hypothetical protein
MTKTALGMTKTALGMTKTALRAEGFAQHDRKWICQKMISHPLTITAAIIDLTTSGVSAILGVGFCRREYERLIRKIRIESGAVRSTAG